MSTTAETVDTQFTVVVPQTLPEPTPGPRRTLATPQERSTSQALLTLGPRRPPRIVPQDAPVEDADLAPADPFPDSYEPRLEPTIVMDTVPDPAMESPPPTQDRWAEALTQGRLWFDQLTGLATEHEVMVNHNTYLTDRLRQCEAALHQCQNVAAQNP